MRLLIAFLLATATLSAQEHPPIEVIIVGVPKTNVAAYRDSSLGTEITKACDDLKKLFTSNSVHVDRLCTEEDTSFDKVHTFLQENLHGAQQKRFTLLFIMTHGEPTENKDVRLLMSDTSDQTKDLRSLLLREQIAFPLLNSANSVVIAFIDACFSGAAGDYRLSSMAAAAEQEGTHAGILASAQYDEKAYGLSFTKGLVDTWKYDCPQNSTELISDVIGRMGSNESSPVWLVSYHDSLCLRDVVNMDKRVISIWRDPESRVRILLFDDRSKDSKALLTLPQDKTIPIPYITARAPSTYRIVAQDERTHDVLDTQYCDFSSQDFCSYFYPPSARTSADSLLLQRAIYSVASLHNYTDRQLEEISGEAADTYRQLATRDPTSARIQVASLRLSEPSMWNDIRKRTEGSGPSIVVNAIGSRLGSNISKGLISEYHERNPAVAIDLNQVSSSHTISGTDASVDFGIFGAPLTPKFKNDQGTKDTKLVYIPVAVTAVVPIYNLSELRARVRLTPETLSAIFLGRIARWDDPTIAKVNPKIHLPDRPITVVHRADSSDTNYIWSDYLSKVSRDWKVGPGKGTSLNWPAGLPAKGNQGVVGLVKKTPGALGYVDFGYAIEKGLWQASVRNASGKFVKATKKSVTAAAADSRWEKADDHPQSIANSARKDAYPIAGFAWLVVPAASQDLKRRQGTIDFVKWLFDESHSILLDVWAAALPAKVQAKAKLRADELD